MIDGSGGGHLYQGYFSQDLNLTNIDLLMDRENVLQLFSSSTTHTTYTGYSYIARITYTVFDLKTVLYKSSK